MRTDPEESVQQEQEATESIQYNPRDDVSNGTRTPDWIRERGGWNVEQGRHLFAWKRPDESEEKWNERLLIQAEYMIEYGGH